MKLEEFKTNLYHYFVDPSGKKQGEYKSWWDNGQLRIHCHYKDDEIHGEYKMWYESGQLMINCHFKDGEYHGEYKSWLTDGKLVEHTFVINGKDVINFLKEPGEYPSNSEDRLLFKLKYGTAPFLDEL